MITGQEILWAYILPASLVLVACLGVAFMPHSRAGSRASIVLVGLVPAGAFALGVWQLYGWPGWVPADSTRWILHFAVISGGVGLLAKPVWLRWIGQLVMAGALPWLLLKPIIQYDWTAPVAMAWVTAYALAMALHLGFLEHMARKVDTVRLLLLLTLMAGATTVVLSLSGSLSLAKISGILTALLLTGLMVSPWLPNQGLFMPLTPLVVVVTCGMWLSGLYYAELNVINASLLYGSVILAWLGMWIKWDRRLVWQSFCLHAILVAVPLAIAFVRALMQFMHNDANSYY